MDSPYFLPHLNVQLTLTGEEVNMSTALYVISQTRSKDANKYFPKIAPKSNLNQRADRIFQLIIYDTLEVRHLNPVFNPFHIFWTTHLFKIAKPHPSRLTLVYPYHVR